jgi:hypothetical protein
MVTGHSQKENLPRRKAASNYTGSAVPLPTMAKSYQEGSVSRSPPDRDVSSPQPQIIGRVAKTAGAARTQSVLDGPVASRADGPSEFLRTCPGEGAMVGSAEVRKTAMALSLRLVRSQPHLHTRSSTGAWAPDPVRADGVLRTNGPRPSRARIKATGELA